MIQPHCNQTATIVSEHEVILSIGDTTFLDYAKIMAKREGYGPIGKGGNGLILHSALAVSPEDGQPRGLLWQKLWHRAPLVPVPDNETAEQKKTRKTAAQRQSRQRPFEEKESYRWVEALERVNQQVKGSTKVIHVFDREGDILEVFEKAHHLERTGVVVRATHDRNLDAQTQKLWSTVESQPIAFYQDLELPATPKRAARKARIAVRFCAVNLRSAHRFEDTVPLKVYAVYAHEVDTPAGETPLSWMLLTTEAVQSIDDATRILRWYTYRWRVEEYHKLLKSGAQVERYRLAAEGMEPLLGFLCVIAVELFQLTYLHRTEPELPIERVLNSTQVAVLKATCKKVPQNLTVHWGIEMIARLGGYLEHRRKSPIGIQVLWRGWSKLQDLCEGWNLATQT
jgi:hypothetical protein